MDIDDGDEGPHGQDQGSGKRGKNFKVSFS